MQPTQEQYCPWLRRSQPDVVVSVQSSIEHAAIGDDEFIGANRDSGGGFGEESSGGADSAVVAQLAPPPRLPAAAEPASRHVESR